MTKMLLKFVLVGLVCASGSLVPITSGLTFHSSSRLGAAQMPAGTYVVRPAPGGALVGDSTRLTIHELNGGGDKLFTGNAVTSTGHLPTASSLVFARYEKQCFLSQVWKANDDRGLQLLRTTAENELIAARKTPSHKVVLAALK